MNLNQKDIEEQIILFVDGELDEPSEKQLMALIEEHPSYRQILDDYLTTRLADDELVVFPDKGTLLKKEPKVLVFKPFRVQWAAAMVLAFIAAMALFLIPKPEKNNKTISKIVPDLSVKQKIAQQAGVVAVNRINNVSKIVPKVIGRHKGAPGGDPSYRRMHKSQETTEKTTDMVTPLATLTEPLVRNMERKMEAIELSSALVVVSTPPKMETRTVQWLPLKEENLQGVDELMAHIQAVKEVVLEKAAMLKNTGFVLRLGGREIAIKQ